MKKTPFIGYDPWLFILEHKRQPAMFFISQKSFPDKELDILTFWKEHKVFEKSLEIRKQAPIFTFYDGPPFATGLPHYGHLLAGTIKDVIPRYKTMKGFYVPRRFGWDCHGLPIENEIEKAKSLAGAPSIEKFGIAHFNEECRQIVLRYASEWKSSVFRMGRWVDFDHSYKTMEPSYMESVWWVFSKLWEQGLVYQGFKVMPYSAKLGTPLSNFEANLNYQDVDDPSITIKVKLKDEPHTFLLVWTTTPWTLPSNLATIVHPKMDYVKLKPHGSEEVYILAKSRIAAYFPASDSYEVIATLKGENLSGKKYHPIFDYFVKEASPASFKVLADEFVGEEDGTGIVHAAPAFGEMDFFVCKREGIEPICPVNQNCYFTDAIPEYKGMFVKEADKDIIKRLKASGALFKHTQIRHRYPFCYRSDTPLIYRVVSTWFVAVEKIKDRLVAANQKIHWMPSHIKDGRFGKWLDNARDWAISRNRYWGTPIPVWRSDDDDFIVISSIQDLEERTGKKVTDLHRHFIDDKTFTVDGKLYKRVPEVFDCWFESGSMPYAQLHYPFEHQESFKKMFPADFIAEGLDQTRGWFYTLMVLSTALYDKPAFKNAVVNGIVLAEDGQKMSKRLRNYPDPEIVISKFGADAVRLYLLNSPVVQSDDLRFSERGVEITLRQVLIPLWNSYYFLATYASIYKWTPKKLSNLPVAEIDRWILSKLQKLIVDVEAALSQYDLMKAVEPFVGFVDELTNWYIRRSRPRFWSEEASQDRHEAFTTLYEVLKTVSKVTAPFVPFLSETIYQGLKEEKDPLSIHLCDFPLYQESMRDEVLEYDMGFVKQAVSMGHSLRKDHKIKVRQPLGKALVVSSNNKLLEALKRHQHLILEELNVKCVEFFEDESSFVDIQATPNFRSVGKKVGPLMNAVKQAIERLPRNMLKEFAANKTLTLEVEGQSFTFTEEDIFVKKQVRGEIVALTEGDLTLTLETSLNDELILEGFAREIVNKVNTMRKSEGFDITDRIRINIDTSDVVKKAFKTHQAYICNEVLATSVSFDPCHGIEIDINGEKAILQLEKSK